MTSEKPFVRSIRVGFTESIALARWPVITACRLPIAPSKVFVDFAAATATGLLPSCMIALLNSAEVIFPFAMASRKSPVNAPFLRIWSCRTPDAPGMASASWFQFSVVSFPAPAVWVSIMATDLKVSAEPPDTAFRLPTAWVRPL